MFQFLASIISYLILWLPCLNRILHPLCLIIFLLIFSHNFFTSKVSNSISEFQGSVEDVNIQFTSSKIANFYSKHFYGA